MARINHVALKVTDLKAATKFYENVFGFPASKDRAVSAATFPVP